MENFKNTLVSVAAMLTLRQGKYHVYMPERVEDGPLNGYLEFPGGKIEAGETPELAAKREVLEETGLSIENEKVKLFKIYPYSYEDRSVTLYVHLVLLNENANELSNGNWHGIGTNEDLCGLKGKVLAANEQILMDLARYIDELTQNGTWGEVWQL